MTSCIRGKRLTARPQGPHGRKRTTPRLIQKYFESISLQRHPPETIWHMKRYFRNHLELTQLANADEHWLIESIPDGFWSQFLWNKINFCSTKIVL